MIQTTPYIGHPAYKAMGGRAAYTLGTALLVGSAGLVGYFAWLNAYIPAPVVLPILVFVGLEITAQSFHATPRRHYAAVALACLPALAFLAMNLPGRILGDGALLEAGVTSASLQDQRLGHDLKTMGHAEQRIHLDQSAVGVVPGRRHRSAARSCRQGVVARRGVDTVRYHSLATIGQQGVCSVWTRELGRQTSSIR